MIRPSGLLSYRHHFQVITAWTAKWIFCLAVFFVPDTPSHVVLKFKPTFFPFEGFTDFVQADVLIPGLLLSGFDIVEAHLPGMVPAASFFLALDGEPWNFDLLTLVIHGNHREIAGVGVAEFASPDVFGLNFDTYDEGCIANIVD
jgi:hypothetical protein